MKQAFYAFLSATLSIGLAAAQASPAAPQYSVTDLGTLPASGNVGAFALNDAGQVVGGSGGAFLWQNGKRSDLGALPPEGPEDFTQSIAYGINNRGQIVGTSGSFGPIFMSGLQFARGILYQGGVLRRLTQQDASFKPYAINDRGQIVGLDAYRGFLYENGTLISLVTLSHVPAGNRSTARAVSSAGQVVGWSTVNAGTSGPPYGETVRPVKRRGQWALEKSIEPTRTLFTHACLWRVRGKTAAPRDLGKLPGWVNSYAYAINDRGAIVGSVSDATGSVYGVYPNTHAHAFLWRQGKMTNLGTLPGGRCSEAFGLNNSGMVVGQSNGKAFLWQSGAMRDLNTLLPAASGWVLTEARAINAKGQIVGSGTFQRQPHAFLLTPR